MAKVLRIQGSGEAVRKQWLKQIVQVPSRWDGLQEAIGMELIPEPLGCGSFGCVFAVADPESPWVVKLTNDQHEVPMWQTILELAERDGYGESGYTQVKEIVHLLPEGKSGKKKLFAIVREAIAPMMNSDGTWTEFSKKVVAPSKLPDQTIAPFNRSGSLDWIERPARDLMECVLWIYRYHEAARYIYASRLSRERQILHRWTIDQAKSHLQRAIDFLKSNYTWQLGEMLEMLWANNIVLNDLRPMNVGWRFLPEFIDPNEDNTLVVFDPGYTATGRRDLPETRQVLLANSATDFEWYFPETVAR